jgi:hypothetical protein
MCVAIASNSGADSRCTGSIRGGTTTIGGAVGGRGRGVVGAAVGTTGGVVGGRARVGGTIGGTVGGFGRTDGVGGGTTGAGVVWVAAGFRGATGPSAGDGSTFGFADVGIGGGPVFTTPIPLNGV